MKYNQSDEENNDPNNNRTTAAGSFFSRDDFITPDEAKNMVGFVPLTSEGEFHKLQELNIVAREAAKEAIIKIMHYGLNAGMSKAVVHDAIMMNVMGIKGAMEKLAAKFKGRI